MQARITRVLIAKTPVRDESIQRARPLLDSVSVMAGHLGGIYLVDRRNGTGIAIDLYSSPEDLANTRQGDVRDEIIRELRAELVAVEEYEVAWLDGIAPKV